MLKYLSTNVGDFWRLWVKWHRTRHKTYKRQTHSGQRKNSNCTSKQARGLFLYIPPGQNSILYDQTCSVQHMYINVIIQQKGVKFRPTAESVQSPYHKKETFPRLQGTISLKAVSVSLAEHLVCKQHISTFPIVAALTLHHHIWLRSEHKTSWSSLSLSCGFSSVSSDTSKLTASMHF